MQPTLPSPTGTVQASQLLTITVAGGQTKPVPIQGNSFYVLASSGPINIRPIGGTFVQYGQQQGLVLPNQFASLEVQCPFTNSSITITLWIGWGYFVDNTRHQKQDFVINSATTATTLTIPDVSAPYNVTFGGILTPSADPIFVQRNGLYVSVNATAGTTFSLVGPASGLILQGIVPTGGKFTSPFLLAAQGPLTLTSSASATLQSVELYQIF